MAVIIFLRNLKLKTFTEQNASDYCQINNINSNDIKTLVLNNNELTDISGIKIFKNLEELFLDYNNISNISVLKDLNNLKKLHINDNKITNISIIKNLKQLQDLRLDNNKITDIFVIQYLKNLIILCINYLELESDQIQYINSFNNLYELRCYKGFKDMDIINQLNSNIKMWI